MYIVFQSFNTDISLVIQLKSKLSHKTYIIHLYSHRTFVPTSIMYSYYVLLCF